MCYHKREKDNMKDGLQHKVRVVVYYIVSYLMFPSVSQNCIIYQLEDLSFSVSQNGKKMRGPQTLIL